MEITQYQLDVSVGQACNIYFESHKDMALAVTNANTPDDVKKKIVDDVEMTALRLIKLQHNVKVRAKENWELQNIKVLQ